MRNSSNHCFICLTLVFGSVQLTAAESATKDPLKKLEEKKVAMLDKERSK